jgi:hypothetical protein
MLLHPEGVERAQLVLSTPGNRPPRATRPEEVRRDASHTTLMFRDHLFFDQYHPGFFGDVFKNKKRFRLAHQDRNIQVLVSSAAFRMLDLNDYSFILDGLKIILPFLRWRSLS